MPLVIGALALLAGPFAHAASDSAPLRSEDAAYAAPMGDYEAYRAYMARTAPDFQTFLNWATPEELADDLVNEDGSPVNWDLLSNLDNAGIGGEAIHVTIRRGAGRMDVVGAGFEIYGERVAVGRAGHLTPRGCHRVFGHERMHYSRKYGMAPMPYSLFFMTGIALHGGAVSIPSHGCVHVRSGTIQALYYAVLAGYSMRVCVTN